MLERWKLKKLQGNITRLHGHSIVKKVNSCGLTPYSIQMALGTIPTGRLLHHLPKFQNMIICPFCDCFEKDTEIHFFNCPRNLLQMQLNPPPLTNFLKTLITSQISLVLNSLDNQFTLDFNLDYLQYTSLVRIYLNRCMTLDCTFSPKEFFSQLSNISFYQNKFSLKTDILEQLAKCFHCTSLLSKGSPNFWKQCRRWYLVDQKVPSILGGWSNIKEIVGASTIIDFLITKTSFNELTNIFSLANQTLYPTRIIFQSKNPSFRFEGLLKLPVSFKSNINTYMFQRIHVPHAFPIDRGKFQNIFGQPPQISCNGMFQLPDPETEVRLRAMLFPFGWVHGFNKIHILGEFTLYSLILKYAPREPLEKSICSSILGFTKFQTFDSCDDPLQHDLLKYSNWIQKYGQDTLFLRQKMWFVLQTSKEDISSD